MNCSHFILKVARKLYSKAFPPKSVVIPKETNPEKASSVIYNLLASGKPCMVARFGSTELSAIVNYLGVSAEKHSAWKFIRGEQPEWWWNKSIMMQMQNWSGFFPPTEEKLSQFCEMMLQDMKEVDVLGSWIGTERWVENRIEQATKVHLMLLEPFWAKEPWTRVLKGKRVVVVHPFKETILSQYNSENRAELFSNPDTLPDFASLRVVKAVQSLGGESSDFANWFAALEWMKREIDREPYDVSLIGCGAYGFPLAAHAKRTGHQAIHLGGALQLLFGIKGKRWENPYYGVNEWGIKRGCYSNLINEYWVRPNDTQRPQNAQQVEGACYW